MQSVVATNVSESTYLGSALAIALGRAYKRGDLSKDAVRRIFDDGEEAFDTLHRNETISEELPGFVGMIVESFVEADEYAQRELLAKEVN